MPNCTPRQTCQLPSHANSKPRLHFSPEPPLVVEQIVGNALLATHVETVRTDLLLDECFTSASSSHSSHRITCYQAVPFAPPNPAPQAVPLTQALCSGLLPQGFGMSDIDFIRFKSEGGIRLLRPTWSDRLHDSN